MQPQKPLRGFRVLGDENAPPPLPAGGKTLHSRNKSSPALSSLHTAAAVKPTAAAAAIRRTVLGDVGNATHNARAAARDDSALPAKTGLVLKENVAPVPAPTKKASAALLRPAQRPLSLANGFKGLLSNVMPGATAAAAAPTEQQPPVAANTRKVLTRRHTTTLRDVQPSTVQEAIIKPATKPATLEAETVPAVTLPQSTVEEKKTTPVESAPVLTTDVQAEEVAAPAVSRVEANVDISVSSANAQDPPTATSSVAPEVKDVPVHETFKTVDHAECSLSRASTLVAPSVKSVKIPDLPQSEAVMPGPKKNHYRADIPLAPVPEPDEDWDEDEDEEENYDDDGFVTARSFRSRGDNVTGNATTTLVPKVNAKVKKEIEAAKQLIESMRTIEDIEDDSWDTTMVAEYGDEIFGYMRDLEVRSPLLSR